MKKNIKKYFSTIMIILTVLQCLLPSISYADQYDDYIAANQQHNIISNEHFIDTNSMSVAEIQSFLESYGSYLAGYSDGGRSAAQIIWDAAHGKYEAAGTYNGIVINESTGTVSPKVILVFLQKEQSLVSRTTYNEWAMIASMGYFCYAGVTGDNNGNNCKDIYEGFTKQVENGAWQLRYNYEAAVKDSTWWNTYYPGLTSYKVGDTITAGTSRTPPDSYQVTLSNQATASCYRYTPYVFFGNYNVWNLFHNIYFSGSVPSPQPDAPNDIAELRFGTYSGTVSLNGTKSLYAKVILGENNVVANIGGTAWSTNLNLALGDNTLCFFYKDEGNSVLAQKNVFIKRHKSADVNGDGVVNISDLAIFAENWGKSNPSEPMADLNSDNLVDITDLAILADSWEG